MSLGIFQARTFLLFAPLCFFAVLVSCDSDSEPEEILSDSDEEEMAETRTPDPAESPKIVADVDPLTVSEPLEENDSDFLVEEGRSPHFEVILENVDLGGDTFAYIDVEEELANLSKHLDELITLTHESLDSKNPDEDLPSIRGVVPAVFSAAGISSLKAAGVSSVWKEEEKLFHNRLFVYFPEGPRVGLMKIFGGKPEPFRSIDLAPISADLIYEVDLGTRDVLDLVRSTMQTVNADEPLEAMNGALSAPVPGLDESITFAELLSRGDLRISVVAKLSSFETLPIGDSVNPAFRIPQFEFLLAFEKMGWLFDAAKNRWTKEGFAYASSDDGETLTASKNTPLLGLDGSYRPVIQRDEGGERLLFASSGDFLASCLAAKGEIRPLPEFRKANQDVPETGHFYHYISGELIKRIQETIEQSTGVDKMRLSELATAKQMINLLIGHWKLAQTSAVTTTENGILVVGNQPESYTSTWMTAPMNSGTILSILQPGINGIQDRGAKIAQLSSAEKIMKALFQYEKEHSGKLPPDLLALIPEYLENKDALLFSGDYLQRRQWIYYPDADTGGMLLLSPGYIKGSLVVGWKSGKVSPLAPEVIRSIIRQKQ